MAKSARKTVDEELPEIPTSEFKANCLRLMDEVARRRQPIVITKRGKPIATLVAIDGKPIDRFGYMAGTIKIIGDIISPLDQEWTGDEENL
jgi:prevent-host-death family protein